MTLVDRLAICSAGAAAEDLFNAPAHPRARLLDRYEEDKLVAHLESNWRPIMRRQGYERALLLLRLHQAEAIDVAERLIVEGKIEFRSGD